MMAPASLIYGKGESKHTNRSQEEPNGEVRSRHPLILPTLKVERLFFRTNGVKSVIIPFFVNGEMFWGNDRLTEIEALLMQGV